MNDSRQETVPERLTREYLEKNYIPCTQEHPIENTYFADFYLNEYKSIIEVYGDYWHVNPKIYGINKREVNEFQKEKIKKDKQRMNFLKNRGYSVYVIWESEIKENIDYYLGKIISEIINKQESATTVRQTLQLYVEE